MDAVQSTHSNTISSNAEQSLSPVDGPSFEIVIEMTNSLQIVDEDRKFTGQLQNQLYHWSLLDVGFDYHIVTAIGSQSSGKSTLLNALFDTTFEVMGDTFEKTTQGIWIGCNQESKTIVMDIESVDESDNNGQDFQNQTALFALASSEILIVNIDVKEAGRCNGFNMPLMKTFLESHFKLYGHSSTGRTLILFTIRDVYNQSLLPSIQANLTRSMNYLWTTLPKPLDLNDKQLNDYFDVQFFDLPHALFCPQKFSASVSDLRSRFTDPSSSGYLYKPNYHKNTPADGLPYYLDSVWSRVMSNEDLDIPAYHELLAQHRCAAIRDSAIEGLRARIQKEQPEDDGQPINGLSAILTTWLKDALESYDLPASRYQFPCYLRVREELFQSLDQELLPVYHRQLAYLRTAHLLTFQSKLKDVPYTSTLAQSLATEAVSNFTKDAETSMVEGLYWEYQEEGDRLMRGIEDYMFLCREDATIKLLEIIQREEEVKLGNIVVSHILEPSKDMWDGILRAFREELEKATAECGIRMEDFGSPEEEKTKAFSTLQPQTWNTLLNLIDAQKASMLPAIHERFETEFLKDPSGNARVWDSAEHIDVSFEEARNRILPLFQTIQQIKAQESSLVDWYLSQIQQHTNDIDIESRITLYSETELGALKERFVWDTEETKNKELTKQAEVEREKEEAQRKKQASISASSDARARWGGLWTAVKIVKWLGEPAH